MRTSSLENRFAQMAKIRKVSPKFAEITAACSERQWDAELFAKMLQDECSYMTVDVVRKGSEEEEIAGFAVFHMNESFIFLAGFGIHPIFQKQGLGRQMLQSFIDLAESEQLDLYTMVFDTETIARKVLLSLGFEMFQTEPLAHGGASRMGQHFRYRCKNMNN